MGNYWPAVRGASRSRFKLVRMKSYRASILWFAPHSEGAACARFEEDGLLVVGANAAGVQVVQAVVIVTMVVGGR